MRPIYGERIRERFHHIRVKDHGLEFSIAQPAVALRLRSFLRVRHGWPDGRTRPLSRASSLRRRAWRSRIFRAESTARIPGTFIGDHPARREDVQRPCIPIVERQPARFTPLCPHQSTASIAHHLRAPRTVSSACFAAVSGTARRHQKGEQEGEQVPAQGVPPSVRARRAIAPQRVLDGGHCKSPWKCVDA